MSYNPDTLYKTYCQIFENHAKPLAFVNLDFLEKNITSILERAGNKKIRIASKSIRCRKVMEIIFSSSSQFEGIMSYSPQEAVFLAEKGFDNILMGYPVMHDNDIEPIIRHIQSGKNILFMTDLPEHFQQLEKWGEKLQQQIEICLDIDMSYHLPGLNFGVWRSSIQNTEILNQRLETLKQLKWVKPTAIMGYEAQIAGLGDNLPGQKLKSIAVSLLKKQSIKHLRKFRTEAAGLFGRHGFELKLVNGGGTGSLETTREEESVTEVTVGSGFFSPTLFDHYSHFKHLPAAGFALEVVRQPKENIYTCLGGGYIASGATGNEKQPLPWLPEECSLDTNEGCGEVQTPVHYKGAEKLKPGSTILFRHSKAGELCEHFNSLHFIKNNQITETVKTYRGEGMCFLG